MPDSIVKTAYILGVYLLGALVAAIVLRLISKSETRDPDDDFAISIWFVSLPLLAMMFTFLGIRSAADRFARKLKSVF